MTDRICIQCCSKFRTYPSRIKRGSGKFCCKKCHIAWQKGKPNGLKGYKWPRHLKILKSEHNKKIGLRPPIHYGKDNYMWRGGVTPINEKIRKSINSGGTMPYNRSGERSPAQQQATRSWVFRSVKEWRDLETAEDARKFEEKVALDRVRLCLA